MAELLVATLWIVALIGGTFVSSVASVAATVCGAVDSGTAAVLPWIPAAYIAVVALAVLREALRLAENRSRLFRIATVTLTTVVSVAALATLLVGLLMILLTVSPTVGPVMPLFPTLVVSLGISGIPLLSLAGIAVPAIWRTTLRPIESAVLTAAALSALIVVVAGAINIASYARCN